MKILLHSGNRFPWSHYDPDSLTYSNVFKHSSTFKLTVIIFFVYTNSWPRLCVQEGSDCVKSKNYKSGNENILFALTINAVIDDNVQIVNFIIINLTVDATINNIVFIEAILLGINIQIINFIIANVRIRIANINIVATIDVPLVGTNLQIVNFINCNINFAANDFFININFVVNELQTKQYCSQYE